MRRLLLSLWLVLSLGACGGVPIEDYRGQQPPLQLREYFNGPVTAWGQFQDRQGRVIRRFVVRMEGRWQGRQGVLEEHFEYDDGQKEQRTWHLTDLGQGRYEGRAADVVGLAQGQSAGPALQWRYTLRLPLGGKSYEVQFNDWMWLHNEQTLVNRARMSKFGITLGEVTLFFRKGEWEGKP